MGLKCPSCGADNAQGKLFCFKCGTKLIHPKAGAAAGNGGGGPVRLPEGVVAMDTGPKRRKGGTIGGIVVLVILILLGGVVFLGMQPVDYPRAPSGGEGLDSLMNRYQALGADLTRKGEVEFEFGEAELNYLWDKAWPMIQGMVNRGGIATVQGVRVRIPGDRVSQYAELSIKGKRVYLRQDSRMWTEDGEVKTKVVGGAIGKLPLPGPLAKLLASKLMKEQEPLPMAGAGGQGLYFDKVDVQPGKIFVRITTDSVVTGGRPGRMLEEARTAVREKRYGEAFLTFRTLLEDYPDSEYAAMARSDYNALLEEVDRRLGAADAAYQTGDYAEALREYSFVSQSFPGTDAAKKAAARISDMRTDPAVQRHLLEAEREAEINSKFQLAENLLNAGKYDRAAAAYREIVEKYPNSPYAEKAMQRLRDLGE
jgi:tetratricopeptide (TPR) repeat protein